MYCCIGISVALICIALLTSYYFDHVVAKRNAERFEEKSKMPVSEFTLSYIKDNSNPNCANQYYRNIEVVEKGSAIKVPEPKPGTIMGTPKTYSSSWFNIN